MTTFYWITDDDLGSITSEDPDFDPGTGWHSGTQVDYDAVVAATPSPVHDQVHAFLSGAGITDAGAVAALHELFGVTH